LSQVSAPGQQRGRFSEALIKRGEFVEDTDPCRIVRRSWDWREIRYPFEGKLRNRPNEFAPQK
jgi:hypothetical protein